MPIVCQGESRTGSQSPLNRDAIVIDGTTGFFLVADGLSSARGGEIASQMASQLIHQAIQQTHGTPGLADDPRRARQQALSALDSAFNKASEQIYRERQTDYANNGMATTATALYVVGDLAFLGHVGDSRAYLVRDGEIFRMTEDHTLVNQLQRTGALRPEDVESFPHRNVLARTLGRTPAVEVDTVAVDLLNGDRFLLCTDGITDVLSAEDIGRVIAGQPAEAAASRLLDEAGRRGDRDDASVIIVDFEQAHAFSSRPPSLRTERKATLLKDVFLFRELTFQELLRLMPMVDEANFASNQEVVREGEQGTDLYIIVEGQVAVSRQGIPVASIGRGGHFGELALIGRGVRSATVIASQPLTLLTISREDFYELVRSDHGLALKLLWAFVQNLADRTTRLTDKLTRLVAERGY